VKSPRADGWRMPPQNAEAEEAMLGGLLIDPSRIADVATILEPEDLFRETHEDIYRAMLDLHSRGNPVDGMTVSEELRRRGVLDRIGGVSALFTLVDRTPHAANTLYYGRVVRQKALARRLLSACSETIEECYADQQSADDLIEAAERRVFALSALRRREGPTDSEAVATLALGRIEGRAGGEIHGIPSGLPPLDALIGGLMPGAMVVLAARPSVGKTSIALGICEHVAVDWGVPVLLISLEMGPAEVGERLLQMRSRIDGHRLRNPCDLDDREWARLRKAAAELKAARFPMDFGSFRTASYVASVARQSVARGNVGLVVVDYLQLLDPERAESRENRQQQVAAASRRLKALAMELEVPILVLSQLNRSSESRDDKRPRLSDLRDSGGIEQDADAVILLHRPDYYDPQDQPGMAEAIVAKNRNGRTGTAQLVFLKAFARFESAAPDVAFGPAPSSNEPVF
jgi:replicative DNA helicase